MTLFAGTGPPPSPLAAVLADPADDLARLVYADWLDDHDDPAWAAAIRVMCRQPHEFDADVQVERLGTGRPSADVAAALSWLETHAPHHLSMTLGGRRCDRVAGEWPWVSGCPSLGVRVEWRRGLVAGVRGPLDAVRQHLPRIVTEHPVEVATPTDRRPHNRFLEATLAVTISQYAWHRLGGSHPPNAVLPAAVYDRLPGGEATFGRLDRARAALSAALLAEARDAGR